MSTNVRVVDLGVKDDLRRRHGVVIGQEQFCLELATLVARSRRT